MVSLVPPTFDSSAVKVASIVTKLYEVPGTADVPEESVYNTNPVSEKA
jgi:hypothetical protein